TAIYGGDTSFSASNSAALSQTVLAGYQYEMGPTTAPLLSGYTRVTDTTAYSTTQGYGWQSTSQLAAVDRGTGAGLLRSFVLSYGSTMTFLQDMANGTYSVTVYMGDASYDQKQQGVFLQGAQLGTLSATAGTLASGTYQTTVTNGQL